jgi:hypothetical protein
VDNLNSKLFTVYKSDPISACSTIKEPFIPIDDVNPTLAIIDMDSGYCGIRRRIQMAKDVGCKGIIILTDK